MLRCGSTSRRREKDRKGGHDGIHGPLDGAPLERCGPPSGRTRGDGHAPLWQYFSPLLKNR
jgi:hypothetical protein